MTYQSLNDQIQQNNGQLQSARNQLAVESQGQITDRLNSAVTNLGSSAIDVRIGGIYALQRIMDDSHRDQPAIVEILSSFVRDHSPAASRTVAVNGLVSPPKPSNKTSVGIPDDVQAALEAIGDRNPSFDGSVAIDLSHTNLSGANLGGLNFNRAIFFESDMVGVNLTQTHVVGADFEEADLFDALFFQADAAGSPFSAASLASANLREANLSGANFAPINYGALKFSGADLTNANFDGANVSKANFKGVNVKGAEGLNSGH